MKRRSEDEGRDKVQRFPDTRGGRGQDNGSEGSGRRWGYLEAEVILYKGENGLEFKGHKAVLRVLEHVQKPLLVFKMHRKTNYRRMYHHVQEYTKVVVEKIE